MERITWTERTGLGRSGWDGTIGKRRLFTIEQSVHRGEGWKMSTSLPFGLVVEKATGHESDAIKAYAERVLNTFVLSLGAVWPDGGE